MEERQDQEGLRGRRQGHAGMGCLFSALTLLVGATLGAALTLGLLGLSWEVLFGRVINPGGAPVVQVGPTPTPRPVAIEGAAPGRRLVIRQPVPLDSDSSTPDLLVISRNYDRNSSTITYVSPDSGRARWESASLSDGDEYAWQLAYGAEHIVVAVQQRLVGLSRATGEQLWEAPLTDVVFTGCVDCVRVFGDSAAVLSQDGQLQAFALESGAPRWSVRLREAPRQIVDAGGLVGVPDGRPEGERGTLLRRFSPADGAEAEPVALDCQDGTYPAQASIYDFIGGDPQGRLLLWMITTGSKACLLSIDAASGAVAGRTFIEEFSDELQPDRMRWEGDTLYLSDGEQIVAVGPQELRRVLAVEEYDIAPLAIGDGTLLVLAQRMRGSSRLELWAVDAQSGERRWERVLTARDWLNAVMGSGGVTAAVVGDAVALVEAHEEPEELRYELIGLRDGVSRARSVLGVADASASIRGVAWGRERLILAANELYTVDLATGQVTARWP